MSTAWLLLRGERTDKEQERNGLVETDQRGQFSNLEVALCTEARIPGFQSLFHTNYENFLCV